MIRLLDKYNKILDDCSICHDQCVFSCPIFTIDRTTTVYPGRKVYFVRCLINGEIEYDEDVINTLYQCCGCGLCKTNCVYAEKGNPRDPILVLHEARSAIINQDIKPKYLKYAEESINKYGNLYGDIYNDLNKIQSANNSNNKDIMFFIDAETLKLNPESVNASIQLMSKKDITPIISEKFEVGYDLKAVGFLDKAIGIAKDVAEYLNSSSVNKIIIASPKVYFALLEWYKELGIEIQKELIFEPNFLYELFIVQYNEYKTRYKDIQNFTKMDKLGVYLEGSFITRYLKNYEVPRMLIKPLFRYYKELRTNKENATPVAPADYPLGISDKIIEKMAKNRIIDIEELHPDYVVTSDAASYFALKKYWDKDKVMSIAEALLMNYVEMYKSSN